MSEKPQPQELRSEELLEIARAVVEEVGVRVSREQLEDSIQRASRFAENDRDRFRQSMRSILAGIKNVQADNRVKWIERGIHALLFAMAIVGQRFVCSATPEPNTKPFAEALRESGGEIGEGSEGTVTINGASSSEFQIDCDELEYNDTWRFSSPKTPGRADLQMLGAHDSNCRLVCDGEGALWRQQFDADLAQWNEWEFIPLPVIDDLIYKFKQAIYARLDQKYVIPTSCGSPIFDKAIREAVLKACSGESSPSELPKKPKKPRRKIHRKRRPKRRTPGPREKMQRIRVAQREAGEGLWPAQQPPLSSNFMFHGAGRTDTGRPRHYDLPSSRTPERTDEASIPSVVDEPQDDESQEGRGQGWTRVNLPGAPGGQIWVHSAVRGDRYVEQFLRNPNRKVASDLLKIGPGNNEGEILFCSKDGCEIRFGAYER